MDSKKNPSEKRMDFEVYALLLFPDFNQLLVVFKP